MQATSLIIEWHNWGLCCGDDMVLEMTTVSRQTGAIHITQYNGRREVVTEVQVSGNMDDIKDLFALIDRALDNNEWESDYSVDVCDGYMWRLYIQRGNFPQTFIHGTVVPLPHGPEIEKLIRKMLKEADAQIEPELFCACK